MTLTKILAAAVAALSLAGAAQADALYTSSAFGSMASPQTNAWCSSCGGSYTVLNPFTLSQASVLTGAETAIQSDYGSNWNVTVSIWDGTHSSVLDTAVFAPANYSTSYVGNDVSALSLVLPSWNLAAGSYYISFYDPNALGVPGYATGGDLQYQLGAGGVGEAGAYQISGVSAVLEVSELSLMLAGLAFVGGAALRRKKA